MSISYLIIYKLADIAISPIFKFSCFLFASNTNEIPGSYKIFYSAFFSGSLGIKE